MYHDEANAKKYIFLENVTSTVEALEAVVISDASVFQVTPSSTLSDPRFAGVRVDGADDLADTEHGWFQITGNATMLMGDSATAAVAGAFVVLDDDSDTGRIGGVVETLATDASAATIAATLKSVLGVFGIVQESSSTTDAEVEVQLVRNAWGV